jgi:hypothetical protein
MALAAWRTFVCLSGVLWVGATRAQVGPIPALLVDPRGGIHASGPPGGPFSPSTFQYRIRSSNGVVKYSIRTPSWLSANPAVGSTDATGVTITITISEIASHLRPGNYGPAVAFTNVTNGRGTTVRTSVLVIQKPTSGPLPTTSSSADRFSARPLAKHPASAPAGHLLDEQEGNLLDNEGQRILAR